MLFLVKVEIKVFVFCGFFSHEYLPLHDAKLDDSYFPFAFIIWDRLELKINPF